LLSSWVWCTGTGTPACQGKDGVGASVEIDISVTSKEQAKQLSTGNVYSMGGGAQMRLSKKIQLEGSASAWTDMPGGGPSLTGTGTTSKFTLKFPKFTTSALYDPDITYSTSSTTSTNPIPDCGGTQRTGDQCQCPAGDARPECRSCRIWH
jgi:hypothetical protein